VVSVAKTLLVAWLLGGVLLAGGTPGLWLDVPFVKQVRNGCGAASIAMVMQYWQHQLGHGENPDSNAELIQKALYSREAQGIYASDLERYLEKHGFRTIAFAGNASDLMQQMEKGRPLIVALKPSASGVPLHYVVVAGIDSEQGVVIINDPGERKLLKRNQSVFEKEWKRTGNWTLLALPQIEGPTSAR
jgi:ABC-type bacteriocin/lantibiotic exporter with double-glycine peptidase domain